MIGTHCPYRTWIGAYLLGSLVPDERREMDAHVHTCADCRAEVITLAGLPGLLRQLRQWIRTTYQP